MVLEPGRPCPGMNPGMLPAITLPAAPGPPTVKGEGQLHLPPGVAMRIKCVNMCKMLATHGTSPYMVTTFISIISLIYCGENSP